MKNTVNPVPSVPGSAVSAVSTDRLFLLGSVVRYGPNRYSISDPPATQIIYGIGSNFFKSSWYDSFNHPDNLFGLRDAKQHSHDRRQYQSAYSLSSLVDYEAYVDECSDILYQRLSEMSIENGHGTIDLGHWSQCYAFDVISLITYSKRLGFLDFGLDVDSLIGNLDKIFALTSFVAVYPAVHLALLRLTQWLIGPKGHPLGSITKFTQDCIVGYQAEPKSQKKHDDNGPIDFLTKFINKHRADPSTFTNYHIVSGCLNNMVAGSDTTAISLSATFYYLLRNPKAYAKLREEVDVLCPTAGGVARHVSFQQSQQMPYLQAVIKESLRMHPATGLPLERVVPPGGATISGVSFPEGVSSDILVCRPQTLAKDTPRPLLE